MDQIEGTIQLLGAGFYWSSHTADLDRIYDPLCEVPEDFILEIIKRVSPNVRFWVVDVGRKVDGHVSLFH
jgi:hypothetical protein